MTRFCRSMVICAVLIAAACAAVPETGTQSSVIPARAAESPVPMLGAFPVLQANAGEEARIDLARLFDPEPGCRLVVPPGAGYTATVDTAMNLLKYRIDENRVGLVEMPLEVHDAAGAVVSRGLLTVAAGRKQKHRFVFRPETKPGRAVVAGSFNDWSQDRTVLADPDGDGTYEAEAWLDAGTYIYKFVVDGRWIPDPLCPGQVEDGFGGYNSQIEVGGAARGTAPVLYAGTRAGSDVTIRVIPGSRPIREISTVVQRADGSSVSHPSILRGNEILLSTAALPADARVRVVAADDQGLVSNAVLVPSGQAGTFSWNDAVMYFAFTDRFHNGDRAIDRPDPNPEVLPAANYHGGDFRGIREMIENGYFDSVGVNVIWVSPLNRNPDTACREYLPPYRLYTGYHGYWPVSPTEIEPRFGDAAELKRLVAAAHARGMKVMADVVLNHVHEEHPFRREHPDWFTKLELPDGRRNLRLWDEHSYTTWFDVFLPDVDFGNPAAERAMLENTEWWLREFGLDGLRLDAVKHIPPRFWGRLRSHLRRTIERERGERLYLVGETFLDRNGIMSFVGPAMLDGQFDFPLYDTLMGVFARGTAGFTDLEASLAASERIYGKESLMSPLVGNHDKSRFMAYADGDLPDPQQPDEEEVGWERPPRVDNPANYEKLKMAFAFLMAIDGVPMIYYGDEFGMSGAADPDNRRPMRFGADLSADERKTLERFSLVAKIRREHAAFRYGHRRTLLVEPDRYAFVRAFFEDRAVAAFNRTSRAADLDLAVSPEFDDGPVVDLLTGRAFTVTNGRLALSLPPRSAAIVVPKALARTVGRAEPESSAAPEFRTVGMAGTFNNWNAGDRSTHMAAGADGTWSVTRVFPEGAWKFKFVMNNGWNVHRGLSPAGRLEQPGADISLEIPKTAFYRVSLLPGEDTWRVEPAPAVKAIAAVKAQEEYLLGREIRLDASASTPRAGQAIRFFRWTQDARDEARLPGFPVASPDSLLIIKPEKPGLYRITLSVDDGEPGMDRELAFRVRTSFQVVDAAKIVHEMTMDEEGRHRLILPRIVHEDFHFHIARNFDLAVLKGGAASAWTDLSTALRVPVRDGGELIRVSPARAGVMEIVYDPRIDEVLVRRSAVTRIIFDPSHAPEKLSGVTIETISVAGEFNGWSAEANPMKPIERGAYEAYLDLAPGVYRYKIVVNGKIWLANPLAPRDLEQEDGFGGVNSGVGAGERGEDYGSPGPGILEAAVKHDPNEEEFFNAYSRSAADVRIRVREGDLTSAFCVVKRGPDSERLPMARLYSRSGFDVYAVDVPTGGADSLAYVFELNDGPVSKIVEAAPGRPFQRSVRVAFPTPDWAKNVVWYQIMLDRWRNGDPRNDPDSSTPWTWDWFKPWTPGESRAFYGGDGIWHRMYGGDIRGLLMSLEYLRDLGVTGLYLNPVFEAPGHHKYNTSDYRHIDDNFGVRGDVEERWKTETSDSRTWAITATDSLFISFLRAAHDFGFKVILDGVFNHSGTEFWAFQDLVKNGRNSPYRDWYVVKEWDVEPAHPGAPAFTYEGWAGFAGLPEYAEDENGLLPGIRNHIFDITRRWQDPNGDGNPSDGADGWRLDVPENVNERFWREWRRVVKGVNPEAYITGEIWENAARRLKGDHYDAVMNYEFQKRVHGFFLPGGTTPALSPAAFARSCEEMLGWYPTQVNLVLQNLLSSHDVDRIASAIHNRAGWKRGRVQDENPSYDTGPPSDADYEILKSIGVFQMTWVGAPMVYYGDEIGMYGADDPTNRMPMWWGSLMPYDNPAYRVRTDLRDHFKRLIAIRNTYPCLRTGRARFLLADDASGVVAFERWDPQGRVVVVMNNSRNLAIARLPLPGGRRYVDVLKPANARYAWGVVSGIGSERQIVEPTPSAPVLSSVGDGLTVSLVPGGSMILVEEPPL